MYHRIINDLYNLEKFIDWLPELTEDECFYMSLFARKKYCPELIKSNDRTQLVRWTTKKEYILDDLRRLEIRYGTLKLRGQPVPQESLVVYINPNPRSQSKALHELGKKCWELTKGKGFDVTQEAISCLQRSKSYTYVVDFDIDTRDFDLSLITQIIPEETYKVVQTRGGYHILVNPAEAAKHNKLWHPQIMKYADQGGDQLLPMPGTTQGGFIPQLLL